MTRFLAFAAAAVLAVPSLGADIRVDWVLAATGVDDGVAAVADVYALVGTNTLDQGVNAITLEVNAADVGVSSFIVDAGGFLNPADLDADLVGAGTGILPSFRGAPITDSFVVLPGTLAPLAGTENFASTGISTSYTTAGGTLIEPMSTGTIAHISVPTGETPTEIPLYGSVVYADNVTGGNLVGIPEPAAALLAGLAAVGFVARRR